MIMRQRLEGENSITHYFVVLSLLPSPHNNALVIKSEVSGQTYYQEKKSTREKYIEGVIMSNYKIWLNMKNDI